MSLYPLETPVPPADLIALSPGYRVPPDLATVPTPLGIRGLRPWGPQHQIECSKQCCRLRDVKRVTASCCNDVMIPYKRSRPDRDAVLWLFGFFGYRLPIEPSAVFVQPCALQEPFRRLSLFPCKNKKSLTKQHQYNTRNKDQINIPKHSSLSYHKSFLTSCIRDFATLPSSVLSTQGYHSFAHKCKNLLLTNVKQQ